MTRVACGECLAINRIPTDRLEEHPNCGRCKRPLFSGRPLAIDDVGLAKMIAGNDIPVVVDFWAPWCAPCRTFAPVFEKAAAELYTRYRFVKLDTEANPQSGAIHGIRSIPTLVMFKSGREIARESGVMPQRALSEWLQRHG